MAKDLVAQHVRTARHGKAEDAFIPEKRIA
jgi:hypothetical protein